MSYCFLLGCGSVSITADVEEIGIGKIEVTYSGNTKQGEEFNKDDFVVIPYYQIDSGGSMVKGERVNSNDFTVIPSALNAESGVVRVAYKSVYYDISISCEPIKKTEAKSNDESHEETDEETNEEINEEHVHKYVKVIAYPSCEIDGYEETYCESCGYRVKTIKPALGHKWVNSFDVDGNPILVCENCKTISIPKKVKKEEPKTLFSIEENNEGEQPGLLITQDSIYPEDNTFPAKNVVKINPNIVDNINGDVKEKSTEPIIKESTKHIIILFLMAVFLLIFLLFLLLFLLWKDKEEDERERY